MRFHRLTAAFVKHVACDEKPKRYGDGNGLYLLVKPGEWAGKYWVQRIVIKGVRREIGLGSVKYVSLKQARIRALDNLQLARAGGDPSTLRKLDEAAASPSFCDAVDKVIDIYKPTWKGTDGGRTARQWRTSLEEYAFPRIGRMPVGSVTSADVMAILLPIWTTKHETAQRVRRRVSAVMKWAIAQGFRAGNPAGDELMAALPKIDRQRAHQRALPHEQVAEALAKIRTAATNPINRLVLEFIVLTAVRSGEARMATWDEVDLSSEVWTVPASRMKSKRQHRVPLSDRAVAVLRDAKSLAQGEHVFPSPVSRRPVVSGTLVNVLRQAGVDAVPHGFRSTFRDWAAELTDTPHAVMEAALAHTVRNQVEAAYARSDLFERRRELMQRWADYVSDKG